LAPLTTFILKVASRCNLDCDFANPSVYCADLQHVIQHIQHRCDL